MDSYNVSIILPQAVFITKLCWGRYRSFTRHTLSTTVPTLDTGWKQEPQPSQFKPFLPVSVFSEKVCVSENVLPARKVQKQLEVFEKRNFR